jgi:hypothetical protein
MSGHSLHTISASSKEELCQIREKELSIAIKAYAEQQGWLIHYERQSGHVGENGKWRGSGPKGKPDLTLARNGRVMLAELKTEKGRCSPEQRAWLDELGGYGHLWRPSDAQFIMDELA